MTKRGLSRVLHQQTGRLFIVLGVIGCLSACGCRKQSAGPVAEEGARIEEGEAATKEQDAKEIGLWPLLGHAFGEVVCVRGHVIDLREGQPKPHPKVWDWDHYRLVVTSVDGEKFFNPVVLGGYSCGAGMISTAQSFDPGPIQLIGFESVSMSGGVPLPHEFRSLRLREREERFMIAQPGWGIRRTFLYMKVLDPSETATERIAADKLSSPAEVQPLVPKLGLPFGTVCRVQGKLVELQPGEEAKRHPTWELSERRIEVERVNGQTLPEAVPFDVFLSDEATAGTSVDLIGCEAAWLRGWPLLRAERFFTAEELKTLRANSGTWRIDHHFSIVAEVEGEKHEPGS